MCSVEPEAQVGNIIPPFLTCAFAQLQFFKANFALGTGGHFDLRNRFVEIHSTTENRRLRHVNELCGFVQTYPKIFNHTVDYRSAELAPGVNLGKGRSVTKSVQF
jgi:hypothetical protein